MHDVVGEALNVEGGISELASKASLPSRFSA